MADNAGDSSEEEGQAFYVGGSETSGQQVVGPPRKKPGKIIQTLFDSAREHGAETVTGDDVRPGHSGAKLAFGGTGYKLGETEDDTEVVAAVGQATGRRKVDMVLKLWKNGFSIKGGESDETLKLYTDPKNSSILKSVAKGEIPPEFRQLAGENAELNLDMEDHRDEEFIPPKVTVKPFAGSGQLLGSPTPAVLSEARSQPAGNASTSVSVDASQPVTSIQIRLADGSRRVQQFNQSHTIADIRTYIAASGYESVPFQLQTSFPVKQLNDETLTLKDANLLNAVIIQKLC